ncbi:fumarylacetoacetate hydrolase [Metarhizium acridum CQMa 102]|uniref:Fumarylacetoacetate hydrolase n=1 Tax=Metarhizium acridum (strain CQMa 102) TaxID=655827 RepID=E9DX15_METAQ|nr:fumarylacetoacetate hydrolase [Metarhizium acridum CQMa 102]EFY91878.1 fumarylacetoacetate hydrolase [Metarhizium acridum CQMa 102]
MTFGHRAQRLLSSLPPQVAGFNEDIPIPKIAQDGTIDYEGELAIVIGKTGNIPKGAALDYAAGYCVSDDVSARGWQRDPAKAALCPNAWLVTLRIFYLRTVVNGAERQNTSTGDLLFGVEELVSFCSQGTTLEAGTVILTGTPSGVAMGMNQPKYLNDGDVVEHSMWYFAVYTCCVSYPQNITRVNNGKAASVPYGRANAVIGDDLVDNVIRALFMLCIVSGAFIQAI